MKLVRPVARLRSNVNFLKRPGRLAEAVEIQIRRELFRLLVEDVERPVEIVDEESTAARLVAQEVHARELAPAGCRRPPPVIGICT